MKKISSILILLLIAKFSFANTDTLIHSGASWKYLDNGTNQGTGWRASTFNDASWTSGNAQLGYGDGDEATVVSYGSNANKKYLTTYFRRSFSVADATIYTALSIQLLRDDGAVVYLNGTEVARSNMPSGNISVNTKASTDVSGSSENTFFTFAISQTLLVTGNNVLAVEVHQKAGNSPDLSFDLRLIATYNTCSIPGGMNTTSITGNSATFNWNTVAGSVSYDVRYRPIGNGTWTTGNTTSTFFNASGLASSTQHEWQVQANCTGQSSGFSSSAIFTTLTNSCNAPSGLSASTVTESTAALSWATVAGAVSYNVEYRPIGGTWIAQTSATNSISLTSLSNAKTYEWHVQSVCSGSSSSYSVSSSFTTLQANGGVLVASNASWKYLDNGTNQGTTWKDVSFNDASWSSGNAELGYGDGDEATVLSYGPNSANKYITTYFRTSFSVSNPLVYSSLSLSILRDDGAVVYINGTEVFRTNMPSGTVLSSTLASAAIGGADETTWINASISTASLVAGNNVIAVEIHQNAVTSSDISFNLSLTALTSSYITLQRGPYLQMVTPTGIHIRWRTDVACNSRVHYGTDMSYANTADNSASTTEHEVVLTNLSAATKYFYTIGTTTSDLQGDPNNYFVTSLTTGSTAPFRVWVIGDFGNGTANQNAVRDAYVTYAGTNRANLWAWLGDNAYSTGTDLEYTNNIFSRYPAIFKNTPLYSCIGNHDYANGPYQSGATLDTNFAYFNSLTLPKSGEAGGVASGTEKYYSYNYGNVHFIVLDSYGALNTSGSPMYTWLQSDLAANTQRWTICYWHHPPYSMGTHNSDTDPQLSSMRQNILPLLEQYKVDLVLCGHSHVYERSVLLNGHYGNESSLTNAMKIDAGSGNAPYYLKSSPNFTGTVYVVCGVSGQGGSVTVQSSWPHAAMYSYSNSLYGSMILDFSNDTIAAKFLTSTGSIYDQFKLVKSGPGRFATNELIEQNNESFNVFPNPFTEDVRIKYFLKEDCRCTITVYDLLGREIFNDQFSGAAGNGELVLPSKIFRAESNQFIIQFKSLDGIYSKTVIKTAGE